MRKLIVSPAPHVHGSESTRKIMLDVIIALAPSMLVAVYFFGLSAVQLLLVSVLVCVGLEYLIQKYLLRRQPTVSDLSAVVTGVLLALNLPPSAPWWVAVRPECFWRSTSLPRLPGGWP